MKGRSTQQKQEDYTFTEWKKSTRGGVLIPEGFIKISGYGAYIPGWIEKECKKKNVQNLKVFYDLDKKAMLLIPSDAGTDYKLNPQRLSKNMLHTKKLLALLLPEGIAVPTLFPCRWSDNYKGWIIDLTNPKRGEV